MAEAAKVQTTFLYKK